MHAEARAEVPLPPDAAWQRLADLSALSQWAPDVAGSPAEALRPGATRWARLYEPTYGKDVLIERITDVDPRRRTFSYDIEGGIGPLRTIRTTWSVSPAQDAGVQGRSVVTVRSDVTLAGAARFVPFLVRRAWTKQLQALADGFARWAGLSAFRCPRRAARPQGPAPRARRRGAAFSTTGLWSRVHPVGNVRGTRSSHLDGRRIVLAVAGSIAAVKAVELARELARHGATVVPVMSEAATRILHPDALEFATGIRPVTRLTGQVEHVALLGKVEGRADLLLVAPATGNTVAKMALGIDDGPVTTCATVAFGSGVPVVVAPAMHEVMLDQPILADHQRTLVDRLGVTWVEPTREEHKAKLADVDAIVEAVIHRLATGPERPGPLAGKRALVVSGATEEPIDPVRVLTNRSSGRSGLLIATELHRLGAEVTLWQGRGTVEVPAFLAVRAKRFTTHGELMALAKGEPLRDLDHVWMPAAVGDYGAPPAKHKVPSGRPGLTVELAPLPKVIATLRKRAPKATLVAFKAESDAKGLLARARDRLQRHGAQYVVANLAAAFGAEETTVHLVHAKGHQAFTGPKDQVLPTVVDLVALAATPGARAAPAAAAGKPRKATTRPARKRAKGRRK